jgi:hypothetical protein
MTLDEEDKECNSKKRFRFKNTIIDNNRKNHKLTFVENFKFEDCSVGHAIGIRTLLDKAVIRKYITENVDEFCI